MKKSLAAGKGCQGKPAVGRLGGDGQLWANRQETTPADETANR
jgi:hypothetical protein